MVLLGDNRDIHAMNLFMSGQAVIHSSALPLKKKVLLQQFQALLPMFLESAKKKQANLNKTWENTARPEQREPTERPWNTWLILAGRGFRKTRTGAETIWSWIRDNRYKHIALIGQTIIEARQVMVEGESGLLSIIPKGMLKKYSKGDGILEFSNGAVVRLYGADRYERLRGPQFDAVWIDELAKFKKTMLFWEQLNLCLRLGNDPKCIITTTPRQNPLITQLLNDADCIVTRGSTFDNAANLATQFLNAIKKQFSGTRLEAQEIYAQMLDTTEGALWKPEHIAYEKPPDNNWKRIVIAVDPADTHSETSDETGIIVIGMHPNGKAYVIEDATHKAAPVQWIRKVAELYETHQADRVVAEINKGGDMVKDLLLTCGPHISYKGVRATRGKAIRAEPAVSLYEQGKVKHAQPLPELEKQLCEWIPGISSKSPDRLDALVWGLSDLFLSNERQHQYKVWV